MHYWRLRGGVKLNAATTQGTQISFPITNYSPNGSAFYTSFTIDWDTQVLQVVIDATSCTTTTTSTSTSASPDDVFDLTKYTTSPIDWASPSQPIVHLYCNGSSFSIHGVNFTSDNPNQSYSIPSSSDKSNITIEISKAKGLTIDGVATNLTATFLAQLFEETNFTFASQEGYGRMHGKYKSVNVVTPTTNAVINCATPAQGKIIKTLREDFTPTGDWSDLTDIDWDTQKIIASIDLSPCTAENDIFAMTTGDGDFSSFHGNATNPNMHWYYTPSNTYVSGYFGNNSINCNSGHLTVSDKTDVKLEISKDNGSLLNGESVVNHDPDNACFQALFKSSKVKVGMGESGKSREAKYNYLRIVSKDYVATDETSVGNVIKENSANTFTAQNHVIVKLMRTLSPSNWNTLCLPFAVSEEMMEAVFGADYELRTFDSMNGSTMNFKSLKSIEAGKPYLIKPAATVKNPTFTGVNITAVDPVEVGENGFKMVGTYSRHELSTDGTQLFLGNGNKFYIPATNTNTMNGLRAYFTVPAGTNAQMLKANIDGNTTAIDAIDNDNNTAVDTPVYNLQGQRVSTSLHGLPRGIYVQNGKKFVVR